MQERTSHALEKRHVSSRSSMLARGLPGLIVAGALVLGLGASAAAASPPEHGNPSDHFNWTNLDYKGKDVLGGTLEKGEEPMSPPMILMLMNFAIVLFLIGWKVRPPVMRYVKNRHDTIKQALDEAQRLRDQARQKLEEYSARMSAAEAEVDKLLKDIRADAEAEKKRIIAEAEAQAQALQRDAEARIAASIQRARMDLEREVIQVAIAAAERLIRERSTTDDQTKLIDTFIHDVQADATTSAKEPV